MPREPLSITLLTDPLDEPSPWAPSLVQDHLRRLGHRVEIRSSPGADADVVHALGWCAARSLASSSVPWVLTPGTVAPGDAEEICRGAATLLVASSTHAGAVNRLGVPHFRIAVLPPAVDCATFTRLGPMANRTHRFRVVTRMSPQGEGLVRAVEALRYAPEAELIVIAPAGSGNRLPADAERIALASGMRSRVAVVETREPRERAWWLRSAHAVVTLDDGVAEPDLVVEAMACGTPVVATPVEAQRELVVHGITGFHVPVRSPISAAGALREIFADDFTVEAFAMAASDRALSRLDWPRIAVGLDGAYRSALDHHASELDGVGPEPDVDVDLDVPV
jgi:glycosyltransferase involved in cell wall biosynthesis